LLYLHAFPSSVRAGAAAGRRRYHLPGLRSLLLFVAGAVVRRARRTVDRDHPAPISATGGAARVPRDIQRRLVVLSSRRQRARLSPLVGRSVRGVVL